MVQITAKQVKITETGEIAMKLYLDRYSAELLLAVLHDTRKDGKTTAGVAAFCDALSSQVMSCLKGWKNCGEVVVSKKSQLLGVAAKTKGKWVPKNVGGYDPKKKKPVKKG